MYRYGFYYARIYRLKRCPRWMKPAIRQAEIAESLLRHCYFAPDVLTCSTSTAAAKSSGCRNMPASITAAAGSTDAAAVPTTAVFVKL